MSDVTALVLEDNQGIVESSIRTLSEDDLPAGDVTVAVEYSTLNYKDGLILKGLGRLVRAYPHVPGIDFAGTVERSDSPRFKPGDKVVLTGWRVGELHWGGYATKARVKAEWLLPLPDGLTTRRAMAIGTAGLTAMLAVTALERHGVAPGREGGVLVTGAAGGLGGVAVAVLSRLGHRVAASTGREEEHGYLRDLGAAEIVDRMELAQPVTRPLLSERWAGAIDTVGGDTLASILPRMRYRGTVAACGNAGGNELKTTVLPFILRGVALLGIDSVMSPLGEREEAWRRLVRDLPMDRLESAVREVGLSDVPALAEDILKGRVRGRTVIDVRR